MGVSRLRLGESSSEMDWESLNMTDVNRRIPSLRIPRDAIVALSLCVQNDCGVASHESKFSKRRRHRFVLADSAARDALEWSDDIVYAERSLCGCRVIEWYISAVQPGVAVR